MHVINANQARRIAAEWHGPMNPALTAFSSSGMIRLDLLDEIVNEIIDLDTLDQHHPEGQPERAQNRQDLKALHKYVANSHARDAQPRWSEVQFSYVPPTTRQIVYFD